MARTDVAHITGSVLGWAIKRAGVTRETLAKALGQKGLTADHIVAWEQGKALPTFTQAEKLAEKLRVPLGILFMPKHPDLNIEIPDLRTVSGSAPENPSINFFEVITESQSRQRWYRELLERQNAPHMAFVGRFHIGDSVTQVASDIASTLGMTDEFRRDCGTWEKFLTEFIQRAEDAGVLVMRSAWAQHSWRRGLDTNEFRGFALSDKFAPLVFVNGADAKAAQIFTLAHELAHIWIGKSGISNPNPRVRNAEISNPIEKYCNAVAAELLIPAANVPRLWVTSESASANVGRLAAFHRVSSIAAAIRARDLGRITQQVADDIITREYKRFEEQRALLKLKAKEKESGPGFWRGFTERVSARFTDAVFTALDNGSLLFRDAAGLLGVKLTSLDNHPARSGTHR